IFYFVDAYYFFFQAEDGIRDFHVTGVQTCALPISMAQAAGKAVLVEINSETDFVAKDTNFLAFTEEVAKTALDSGAQDAEALKRSEERRVGKEGRCGLARNDENKNNEHSVTTYEAE